VQFKIVLEDVLNQNLRPSGVGEEGRISRVKRTKIKPMIKPERGGSSILDFNPRDGPKGIQLVVDDVPKVVARLRDERERGRGIEYPVFPGGVLIGEDFADEFHEQASVLELETLHSQATPVFGSLNKVPSHKTF
jgi:hypothetical protein